MSGNCRVPVTLLPVTLLLWASVAQAEGLSQAQYLAFDCQSCHLVGQDNGSVPQITGRPAEEITALLHEYREKKRPNDVMQVVAGRLDAEQISALAAYLHALTP